MHELLYAAAPAAVGAAAGVRLWAHHRAMRRRPGEAAPGFDLPGTDGRRHSLDGLDEPAVAVLFMSNRCPGVKAYDGRLRRLMDAHWGSVRFVGINPVDERHYPREDLRGMAEALRDRGLRLLYLKDADGAVAHAYGAVCTPEVVLLDGGRRIAYRGRIDDSMVERGVRHRYLEDAVAAVLRGRAPKVRETVPLGCSIEAAAVNPIVAGAKRQARVA
jgi:hypothetical protein